MRIRRTDNHPPVVSQALERSYAADRADVDAACRRLRAVASGPHAPAAVRAAAADLTAALQKASATATQALQTATPPERVTNRRWQRRDDGLRAPKLARPWTAELARLADIAAWLRRVTADVPGVQVPMAVQINTRAASGPHGAGFVLAAQPPLPGSASEHPTGAGGQSRSDSVGERRSSQWPANAAGRTESLRAAA